MEIEYLRGRGRGTGRETSTADPFPGPAGIPGVEGEVGAGNEYRGNHPRDKGSQIHTADECTYTDNYGRLPDTEGRAGPAVLYSLYLGPPDFY